MKKNWTIKRIPADYKALSEMFGLDPVTIRILVNRGYDTEEKIKAYFTDDESVFDASLGLPDYEKALTEIKRFIAEHKKVRILGDYDIDGVCATAILLKGLSRLGMDVDYVIPHRVLDGYGMNRNLIEQAREDGIEGIITCDNGIAAKEEVDLANSYGIEVIVTDHHEIPEILPDALAVVDQKRKENTYPNREICGAYLAYKVVIGLINPVKTPADETLIKELRILAGFATVGDVMPLCPENRSLVRYCLTHLKDGVSYGLSALIHETELEDKELSVHSIGFILGPCINATGRLDSASNALELLMCTDSDRAKELAKTLVEMNEERKAITAKGQQQAVEEVQSKGLDFVEVLYLPEIHESITGLVAGRIKEVFYRPTLCFTNVEGGKVKGSGRSIEGYDMFAKLSECRDLFDKFGGHPMAAGITMPKENIDELRKRLNQNAGLSEENLAPTLCIDADMPFAYVTKELIEEFHKLEPYGVLNEKPVFARKDVNIISGRIVGKNHDVGIFTVKEEGSPKTFTLKLFRDLEGFHHYVDEQFGEGSAEGIYRGEGLKIKVAYFPDLNTFRGVENVEFIMTDYSA